MTSSTARESMSGKLLVRSWTAYALGPVVGLATAPILARALGPEGRGLLAAVLQPMTVADAVAAAGVPAAAAYFTARTLKPRQVQRAAIVVVVAPLLAAVLALIVYAVHLDAADVVPLSVTLAPWVVMVSAGALFGVRRAVWQGVGVYARLDCERAAGALLRLMAVVVLALYGAMTFGPYVVAYLLAGAAGWAFLLGRVEDIRRDRGDPEDLTAGGVTPREIAKFAAGAAGGAVAIALNNRLDQAVLPALVDLEVLGLYSVAVTIAEIPVVLSAVVSRNLLRDSAAEGWSPGVRKTWLLGGIAVVAISVSEWLLTPLIVQVGFGPDFTGAAVAVRILLIATVLGCFGVFGVATLTGLGRPYLASAGPLISAAATIVVYALLAERMTLVTASWISVMTQATFAGFCLLAVLASRRSSRHDRR